MYENSIAWLSATTYVAAEFERDALWARPDRAGVFYLDIVNENRPLHPISLHR
jgi:hypothetical protein